MTTQDEILRKLEMIAKLLAMNLLKDKPSSEQIEKLNELGFKNKEIATILGKTENNVKVTLSDLKKSKKQQGTKKDKASSNE